MLRVSINILKHKSTKTIHGHLVIYNMYDFGFILKRIGEKKTGISIFITPQNIRISWKYKIVINSSK